jgi:hypothetical protein
MVTISSIDVLIYTILAFIPGYIIDSIIRLNIPIKKRDSAFGFFRFLVFSMLNYLPWCVVLYNLYKSKKPINLSNTLLAVIITFIFPIVVGLFVVNLAKYKWFNSVLKFIGLSEFTNSPCAWDSTFYKISYTTYIIVVLLDGTKIYGRLSENSNVSSCDDGGDIYIGEIYTCDDAGKWKKRDRTKGMFIRGTQIKYLELF